MQAVESKRLRKNARILNLDEPTAPLSTKEPKPLFELIGHLKQQGVTIYYTYGRIVSNCGSRDSDAQEKDIRRQAEIRA